MIICEHCQDKGHIETDNNGPIGSCPVCKDMDKRPAKNGWAPGLYSNTCYTCGIKFLGHKLTRQCSDCAYGTVQGVSTSVINRRTEMKKRMTVLKAFHKTLCEVAKNMGCDEPYLCEIDQEIRWEGGPFEWAPCLTGGSHLYAGELGNYSKPLENEGLIKAIAQVKEDGYFIECVNNYTITVYEA